MPSYIEGGLMQISQKSGINYIAIFRFGLYSIVIYIVRVPQEADCEKVGVSGNAVVMFCGLSRQFCILFRQEGRTRK
jgi:hypothetical protein